MNNFINRKFKVSEFRKCSMHDNKYVVTKERFLLRYNEKLEKKSMTTRVIVNRLGKKTRH